MDGYFVAVDKDKKPLFLTKYADNDFPESYTVLPAADVYYTSELVAAYMDQDAENQNRHAFVGVHAGLLSILKDHLGEIACREIYEELLDLGGLPELKGFPS